MTTEPVVGYIKNHEGKIYVCVDDIVTVLALRTLQVNNPTVISVMKLFIEMLQKIGR